MSLAALHVTEVAIGFGVALSLGLTGMGGGTFTTPALVLVSGLPAAAAVGTSLAFTAIVRIFAWPYYFVGHRVHREYLLWLVAGAVPALAAGTWALRRWSRGSWDGGVLVAIGAMLVVTSGLTFLPVHARAKPWLARRRWLALMAIPIGFETGFSSAGSGAIGGLLLLNFADLTPQAAVGTNLMFGLVLTLFGAALHWSGGTIRAATLARLLAGGVPGILLGGALGARLPARRLRPLVGAMALALGVVLLLSALHLNLS